MQESTAASPPVLTVEYLKTIIRQTVPEDAWFRRKGAPQIESSSQGSPLSMIKNFIPVNDGDEVYPGIYIGNEKFAKDKMTLKRLGITHILNSAQGNKFVQINTTEADYADIGLKFLGIKAQDTQGFQMAQHFESAAEFIHSAKLSKGKVAVHCHMGMSRSATLVLAYLMIYEACPLVEATQTIRKKRPVFPNDGFIAQLIKLEEDLAQSRGEASTIAEAGILESGSNRQIKESSQ